MRKNFKRHTSQLICCSKWHLILISDYYVFGIHCVLFHAHTPVTYILGYPRVYIPPPECSHLIRHSDSDDLHPILSEWHSILGRLHLTVHQLAIALRSVCDEDKDLRDPLVCTSTVLLRKHLATSELQCQIDTCVRT